jgi:predicted transcriptional regulator
MPPRPSITLTPAELRLMRVLWTRGESAVAELVEHIDESLAYTSVLTTIRVLESKGYVSHRQEGRAFLYSPAVAEQDVSRSETRHLMERFFSSSREKLLLSLMGDGDIDPEELRRLKQLVASLPDDLLAEDKTEEEQPA